MDEPVTGWTLGDVARFLGVSASTVKNWARQGKLGDYQFTPGGQRRFDPDRVRDLARAKGRIA